MVHPVLEEIHEIGQELLDLGDREFVERFPSYFALGIQQGMLEGIRFAPHEGSYSRRIVAGGGKDEFTILAMRWAPGYELCPHTHHGRPCIDYLVEGEQMVTEYEQIDSSEGLVRLLPLPEERAQARDILIVRPWIREHHSIRIGEHGARSLHMYPQNASSTFGFEHVSDEWYRCVKRELLVA